MCAATMHEACGVCEMDGGTAHFASAMVTDTHTPPAARSRRVPLWPWLLLPAVVLAVFLILHSVRQMPPPDAQPLPRAVSAP